MQDKSHSDNFLIYIIFINQYLVCSQVFADAGLKENKEYTSVVLIEEVKLIILGDVASE